MDNELETTENVAAELTKEIIKGIAIAAAPYVTFVAGRYIYRKVQARKAQKTQTEEN